MKRLLYISTARPWIDIGDLEAILATARRRNAVDGITGLLAWGERRFLQALEGGTESVDRAFARISQDQRHFAVVTLSDRPIESREFADWAMAFWQPVAGVRPLRTIVRPLIERIGDATVRAEFAAFAARHGMGN